MHAYVVGMRFSREHLIFKALCVLRVWADRAAQEPVKPDVGVRFALAFLFTCGKGDRRLYDGFWRELSNPGLARDHESMRRHMRQSRCDSYIKGIVTDVGAPHTPEFWSALSNAADRKQRE